MPSRSGLISKENFKQYFGQFAGRAFLNNATIFINSATRTQLESIEGISYKKAEKILQNRPFSDIEDLKKKVELPKNYVLPQNVLIQKRNFSTNIFRYFKFI